MGKNHPGYIVKLTDKPRTKPWKAVFRHKGIPYVSYHYTKPDGIEELVRTASKVTKDDKEVTAVQRQKDIIVKLAIQRYAKDKPINEYLALAKFFDRPICNLSFYDFTD